jgi:hypothetical protein
MSERLVVGLLEASKFEGEPELGSKIRDLTISWLRFKYTGEIIEDSDVNLIVDRAVTRGFSYCLILACGEIATHAWSLGVVAAIEKWASNTDFLVAADFVADKASYYGIRPRCMVVDLVKYRQLGSPSFGEAVQSPIEVAVPLQDGDLTCSRMANRDLCPSGNTAVLRPQLPGWNFISVSLASRIPVRRLPPELDDTLASIVPETASQARILHDLMESGIATGALPENVLSRGQMSFLKPVQRQAIHSRSGIFVWNFEGSDEISRPATGKDAPVSSIYSVAAGLKTYWLLETQGFNDDTRIVFFDYSERALEYKQLLHEKWDGRDYPRFLRYLFEKIPPGQAFYQLWGGQSVEQLDWRLVNQTWTNEINRWGGADIFADCWQRIRRLPVEYVACDVLTEPDRLLSHVRSDANSVIWWSNVFFTFFSNWHYSCDDRQGIYMKWLHALTGRCPQIRVYGKDHLNVDISGLQLSSYVQDYFHTTSNALVPWKRPKTG